MKIKAKKNQILNLWNISLFLCFVLASAGVAAGYDLKTDFGAMGDGTNNDSFAFRDAASTLQADGGGSLYIPAGTYIVGEQFHVDGQYPYYQDRDIFTVSGVNGLIITGAPDAIIKIESGLHYGSFDRDTGERYDPTLPFIDWRYRADVGSVFFINSSSNILIENLEIDGNNENFVLGGLWGDAGRQCDATGVRFMGCSNVVAQNIYTHHHGLDGFYVDGLYAKSAPYYPTPHYLTNVISEYNSRQGLSWCGGIGLTAVNCKFNHTGRSAFASLPQAGVDIEAEGSVCRDGWFDTCEFINNAGPGMVAAGGDIANVAFDGCTFWGVTQYALSANKPYFVFTNCNIYGCAYYGYSATNSSRMKFHNCYFEDQEYNGNVAADYLVSPTAPDAGNGTEFVNCDFVANTCRALYLNGADTKLKNCTILHKYSGLADKSYQSLLYNGYFENVRFMEDFGASPTSSWYIRISNPVVADDVVVDGPYCKWENYSYGITGTIPINVSGYWKLDEGSGTAASDSEGIYEGTIYGGATWVDGALNSALDFDGADDYVAIDDCVYNKAGQISGLTVMAWIKTTNTGGDIISWDDSEYWSLGISGGKVSWETCGQTQGAHTFESIGTINDGVARHVAVTYDSATGRKDIYIDGQRDSFVTAYSSGQKLGTGTTRYGFIGVGSEAVTFNGANNGQYYDGVIDEVRVIRRACSSNEIYTQYQTAQAVGFWNLDEGKGATAKDSSVWGNHGTLVNMDTNSCWVNGKIGKALKFDGTDDYVNCGTNSSLSFADKEEWSFEAWLYMTNGYWQSFTGTAIYSKYLMIHYNTLVYFLTANQHNYTASIGFALNTWQHLVVTADLNGKMRFYLNGVYKAILSPDTTAMDFFNIGRGNRQFNGIMDDVRVYSKALTAAEVEQHYRERACWYFDEGAGAIAYDSVSTNHGMLVNMNTNTCWVDGKIGKALEFDGANDYVNCGNGASLNITNAITIETWVYLKTNTWQYIFGKGYYQNGGMSLARHASGMWMLNRYNNGPKNLYFGSGTTNQWHHLTITGDLSVPTNNWKVYQNGVCMNTDTWHACVMSNTYNFCIGRDASDPRYCKGIIDEFKIYHEALSAEEIYDHYSEGL